MKCPFDMQAVGLAIGDSLTKQGHSRCKYVVIVVDEDNSRAVASNLIETESASQLLAEAAIVMQLADEQLQEEPVGHA